MEQPSLEPHGDRRANRARTRQTARPRPERDRASDARSSYGQVPGAELHGIIYRVIFAAYVWMMLAAWVAFGGNGEADLALSFAVVLFVMFFTVPFLLRRTAAARSRIKRRAFDQFLSSEVETATGPLSGREVSLQVLLIPLALAFAATMIGAVFILES